MVFGTISETIGDNVRVKSEHEDEKLLGGIDQILFCTGYHYDFPFLKSTVLPDFDYSDKIVYPLYKQLWYANDPSLIFFGLPFQVVPLPLLEAQAVVAAKTVSGKTVLPEIEDMKKW